MWVDCDSCKVTAFCCPAHTENILTLVHLEIMALSLDNLSHVWIDEESLAAFYGCSVHIWNYFLFKIHLFSPEKGGISLYCMQS